MRWIVVPSDTETSLIILLGDDSFDLFSVFVADFSLYCIHPDLWWTHSLLNKVWGIKKKSNHLHLVILGFLFFLFFSCKLHQVIFIWCFFKLKIMHLVVYLHTCAKMYFSAHTISIRRTGQTLSDIIGFLQNAFEAFFLVLHGAMLQMGRMSSADRLAGAHPSYFSHSYLSLDG